MTLHARCIIISFQILSPDLDSNTNVDCGHTYIYIYIFQNPKVQLERSVVGEQAYVYQRFQRPHLFPTLRRLINKLAILSGATRYTSSLLHHACSFVSSSLSYYLGVRSAFFSLLPEREARFLNRANASTRKREK